ncbi:MAG: hypothetical protein ACM357_02490 [Gemmatimonadota bacterium]
MSRVEISIAAYLLITGCAASHQPAANGLAPVSPAAVQVFLSREPERPYVSIARFTIERSGELSRGARDDLVEDARRSAAEMGANAIVVTPIPAALNRTRLAKGSGTGGGTVEEWSERRVALDVVAVVWACGGGPAHGSDPQPRSHGAYEDSERLGGKMAP